MSLSGFKVWMPHIQGRYLTLTENGLMIPGSISGLLPGKRCDFGWDGGKRFLLQPGSDLLIYRQKNNRSLRLNSRPLTRFIWDKLEKPYGTRLELVYEVTNNMIVFGDLQQEAGDGAAK